MDIVTNIFDNIASIPGVFPSCLDKYISSVSWGRPPTAQARPGSTLRKTGNMSNMSNTNSLSNPRGQ